MAQKTGLGIPQNRTYFLQNFIRFTASVLTSLGRKDRVFGSGATLVSCDESRISDVYLFSISIGTCLWLGFWGYRVQVQKFIWEVIPRHLSER